MPSKTPNFDKAVEKILSDLSPCQVICRQCQTAFEIFSEDIEFYKKFKVPPPTLCSRCRLQRRLGFRVYFLPIFYKKSCSAPGHSEKIIAFYSDKNPVKVYDDEYYLSDKWDGLEFGADYDFSKPFFEQYDRLAVNVPHQSLNKDPKGVDCDYVISGIACKNCYYTAVPYHSENVFYSYLPADSRNSIDISNTNNCEQCYESVNIKNCYNCDFCYDSVNCLDSYFLYDCHNCQNCFGCVNLRNKQYCFFNEQLTKEQYEEKLKSVNLGKKSVLKEYIAQFGESLKKAVRRNVNNVKTENCFGSDIGNSRNCFNSFLILGGSENLRYVASADKISDSMDISGGAMSSLIYESAGVVSVSKIKFSFMIRTGLEVEYSIECNNCEYCFGCCGLKNKKYCVFNKQYGEDEYWRLVDKIKTEMLKTGEYGEFFPLSISLVSYSDSTASVEFPLPKEQIVKNGWHWEEEEKSDIDLSQFKPLQADEVPDDIKNVSDDILKSVIICEQTQKPFRITEFELDFYRKKNLPLPTVHPLQRIKNRFSFRRPFRLWNYPCSKCGKEMFSSYDPEKKLKVYCEDCYLKEFV